MRTRSFEQLLARNVVTGCAAAANRALVNLLTPVPHSVVMHDHWAALTAAAFGSVTWMTRPTVSYRQHDGNVVGAVDGSWAGFRSDASGIRQGVRRVHTQRHALATTFRSRFGERLDPAKRATLDAVIHALEAPSLLRPILLARAGVRLTSWKRTMAFYAPFGNVRRS